MSRGNTIPSTYRLSPGEKKALQQMALAGYVFDASDLAGHTEVGVIRKLIREGWQKCDATREEPFPGDKTE